MQKPANPDEAPGDGRVRPPARREPYRPPELVEYGTVSKLTQGSLTNASDFFGGGFRMTG
jgi:hypothetical protein